MNGFIEKCYQRSVNFEIYFCRLQFLPKNERKHVSYIVVKINSFVRFLEEFQKYRLLKQLVALYLPNLWYHFSTQKLQGKHQKNHQVIDVGLNNQSSKGFGFHSNDPNCTVVRTLH